MFNKLKEDWEKFVRGYEVSKDIRPEILSSWYRCEEMKVDFEFGKGTKVTDKVLAESLSKRKDLIEVARPIMENVFEIVKDTSYSVVLTDEKGIIIDLIINKALEENHKKLNFVLGSLWDEKSVGNNAIGSCLAMNKPIQVIGAEHYCEYHHRWTCSAAPIHNSKGELIGCFDLSGRAEDVQAHTYGIAVSSANSIEKQFTILESYKLMDTTFDSILDGLMIMNSEMKIYKFNHQIPEIFKLDETEIYNIKIMEVFKDFNIVSNIFNNKQKIKYSDITLVINDKKIECSLTISPIILGNDVIGAVFLVREAKQIRKEISKLAGFKANYTFDSIVTVSSKMEELIKTAKKISKTNCSVLIEGESGVGKELYAQSIHNESFRRNAPFIAINCSAIPKELFESELFGYESGSFTGAMKGGRPGKFELARGGTIFLDEIGEIPLDIQPKLLRVLDNNKIVRIGGTFERDLDVRVIAATNRNLLDEIRDGSFRQDLYYRLNVINLRIPPLKDRKEDILELAKYFLNELNKENEEINKTFSSSFEGKLMQHEWVGNVRELKNIIQRAYHMSEGEVINNIVLSKQSGYVNKELTSFNLKEIEKDSILQALSVNNKNAAKAAQDLNISKATIYRKIKLYSIDLDKIEKLAQ
ncbi:sigma-54-dependent Fis family transcriptional regulator [Sedimentibacter sp.]|uniref:sigma-54-dependent Fis family transcriptional regulator n=1 Tax=Sedimentibacter sp. TaxID=1960295 RepID=UPI0028AF0AC8|nr:sigma-54-dependent Fis family transcriptional regulator [Sedimentibacter sp.]